MGPATAIKTSFAKSFQFKGRASRSEFWWFALVLAVASTATPSKLHAEDLLTSTIRSCHDFELDPGQWSDKIEQFGWHQLSEEDAERWWPAYVVSSLSISWPGAGDLRQGLFDRGMDQQASLIENPRVTINWWSHFAFDEFVLRTSFVVPPETLDDSRLVASCSFVTSNDQTIDHLMGFQSEGRDTAQPLEISVLGIPDIPVLFAHTRPEYLAFVRDAAYSPTSVLKTLNAKFPNEVPQ